MATRQQVADALKVATSRGDQNDARKLQAWLNSLPTDGPEIPSMADMPGAVVTAPAAAAPDAPPTTFAQDVGNAVVGAGKQIVGVGETAAAIGTGATAGTVAGTGAFLKGIADAILRGDFGTQQAADVIQQGTEAAASAATYAPRTDAGKAQTAVVGDAAAALAPLAPLAPELGAAVPPGAAQAASGAVAKAGQAVTRAPAALAASTRRILGKAAPSAAADVTSGFGPNTAGSAQAPVAALRQANAEQLGFTGDSRLTKGQLTGDKMDIGFEAETAKRTELGKAFRERTDAQHAQIGRTVDNFIDQTGGAVPDFSGGGLGNFGKGLTKALGDGATKERERIKTIFTAAGKSEGQNPTVPDTLATVLAENDSLKGVAPVLNAAEKEGTRLGIFAKQEDGAVVALPTNVANLYQLRKFINKATSTDPTDIRAAIELKKAIDEKMLADGGTLYKQAIGDTARFKGQYENASLVKDLLKTEYGAPDRTIANEQVLGRILSPGVALEEVKHLRRLLQTHGGEAGAQAWRDLQAGTLEQIKAAATQGTERTPEGLPTVSAAGLDRAIRPLDKSGKLDYIFGTQGADKLRTLNDITKSVLAKGGNPSGTSSAIFNAIEQIPGGGHAVKVLRAIKNQANDYKTNQKIKEHLR